MRSKNLSEKELLNDLIMSERQLSSSYNNSLIEINCDVLREIINDNQIDVQNIQFSLFSLLDNRGYNKIKLVNKKELKYILELYNSQI